MSLNEGCYYAILDLAEGIRESCQLHENREYISGIVDAMFSLARIAVKIEVTRRDIPYDIGLMESRVVLTSLLDDADDYEPMQKEAICNLLIDLASTNSRFANALRAIDSWLETDDGKRNYADECPKYSILSSILRTAALSECGVAA